MWPRRDLIDLFGIEHPILQAPMAGDATPALAAAVSNAGGLGGLGCSSYSADELRAQAGAIRAQTNRPFNLNFFAHAAPQPNAAADAATSAKLASFYAERGLGAPPQQAHGPTRFFGEEQLEAVLQVRPSVVSFHFGLPSADAVSAIKAAGCKVISTATTVREARALQEQGADAIIAQGWEAGGHRGSFEPSADDAGVGTLALVPQVVDAVNCPVIAAGGIADGRGIAAAFMLGASGVQMGTAFLVCPESAADETYRKALASAGDDDTRLSRAFSGRPARTKLNRYVAAMAGETTLPDFPTMYAYSKPLTQSSEQNGDEDFAFLLFGQAAALSRALPAAELMGLLVEETKALLRR